MNDDCGPRQVTGSLPPELSEALAFYDRLAESAASREDARRQAVAQFSEWAEALREHFRLEDCLLGVTDSPFDSTQLGLPPDGSFAAGASATASGAIQSRLIPRYLLGVGGQGEVWLAHDPELDRFVALKVIKEAQRGSQPTAARFWREAELTGKLEHPNIVPVYEAGRSAGSDKSDGDAASPYYVMRVFGNRHLLRAITAFHARERRPQDWELLEAIKAFHEKRSTEHAQRLQQALGSFPFDDTQECDQDLNEACEALHKDPAGQSGRSLQEAITAYHASGRQPGELRELLGRFIDICNAMAYAHSRGVIHRDLKPQNVMLGEFGETLVVDWGLAKVVGRKEQQSEFIPGDTLRMSADESEKDSHTQQGAVVGTLAYMPPEQAWGKIDELTAATDVYSLGGILYMLLTGQPPRTGTSKTQLLEAARSGQVSAPTSLQPDLPKALEAVCLKALSKSPAQRYATAKDLSADVGRWLADEPVSAWPEPVLIRAKRWVKGHQTLVGSTAAAVLVAVVTLSTLVAVVSGKNSELNTAYDNLDDRNRDLQQANTDLVAANQREEVARILAQNNEQAAREQSQLALSTLTQVIFDVQRGLEDLPGGGEVRRRLLATSLEKLEQVASEYVEQATVDGNTIVALSDLGDVILRFGVGDQSERGIAERVPGDGETRLLNEEQRSAVQLASVFYSRANELATLLEQVDQKDSVAKRYRYITLHHLGDVCEQLGRSDEARIYHQQANESAERLAQFDPTGVESQRHLAISLISLGDIDSQSGELQESQGHYQRAREIFELLAANDPNDWNSQGDLAASLNRLANVLLQMGLVEEALGYHARSHDIDQRRVLVDPTDREAQRDLAVSLEHLGSFALHSGEVAEANGYYSRSLDIFRQLALVDLQDTLAQRSLSISLRENTRVRLQQGELADALACSQECLDLSQRRVERDEFDVQALWDLATSLGVMADVHQQMGTLDVSLEYCFQSLDILESLAEADATNSSLTRDVAIALGEIGSVKAQLGRQEEALQDYQRALTIITNLAEMDPADTRLQREMAFFYDKVATWYRLYGDLKDAVAFYRNEFETFQRLAAIDPTDAAAQLDLAIATVNLGDMSLYGGDTQGGLEYYEQAHTTLSRLAALDVTNFEAQRRLATSYERMGNICLRLGRSQSAMEWFHQMTEVFERIAANPSSTGQAHRELALAYERLGDLSRQLENDSDASRYYEQSLDIRTNLVATDQSNSEAQRDLSLSFERLGRICLQKGQLQDALGYFRQMHDIKLILVDVNPTSTIAQRDLSVSYECLGRVNLAMGNTQHAMDCFIQSLHISEQLAADNPMNADAQRDLSIAYFQLGSIQVSLGDWRKASEFYLRDLAIAERIAAADPTNAEAQLDLVISHRSVARASREQLDFETAIAHYTAAVAILERMIENSQDVASSRQELESTLNTLREVQHVATVAPEALAPWEMFIRQPDYESLMNVRVYLLMRADRWSEIPQTAAMLRSLDAENPDNLYNAACGYSLCADAIRSAEGESLTAEQHTQRQEYIDLSLACLRESIAAGWSDFEHMQQDPDLAILRDNPEFQALLPSPPEPDSEQE